MNCPKCNQEYLVLIAGDYGVLFPKNKQYYKCLRCAAEFKCEEIENECKKSER